MKGQLPLKQNINALFSSTIQERLMFLVDLEVVSHTWYFLTIAMSAYLLHIFEHQSCLVYLEVVSHVALFDYRSACIYFVFCSAFWG